MKAMVVIGVLLSFAACKPEPCDPGYELRDGVCWLPVPVGDAGTDTAAAGPTFGSSCSDGVGHSDCASPANVCLIQPGQPTGFCSAVGCDQNPSLCPAGWACFDLSQIQPGAPWGCVH
ncbi:MAG: hypothetical protein SF187_25700 [Deltaproteobacteria bacterium]|nr:hypothetical protein [Deltaproteobacteria bacterium]